MDQFTLVCSLATHAPATTAAQRWCFLCGAEVWVSMSMVRRVDAGEGRPICEQCASGALSGSDQEVIVHPDQIDELRGLGMLDMAKRFVKRVNQSRQAR
jgi:hypothetical protein